MGVEWTPCTFGGERPWLLCPDCAQRVGVLYDAGEGFFCRICGNLAYREENETRTGRKILKAKRLRVRLGGSGSLFEELPGKPHEMSGRTYVSLRARGEQADRAAFEAIEAELRANEVALLPDLRVSPKFVEAPPALRRAEILRDGRCLPTATP